MSAVGSRRLPAAGALVILFLATWGLLAAFAAAYETPAPRVHDEFGYLLTGDTFAGGRLTNPSHPMWEHFETFHVFHQPTYQAKYPPAQGGLLALGQLLGGHPAVGVWIGMALACAAVAWALSAVVPLRWALFGPLLFLLNIRIFHQWGETYWGGGAAMFGGALFIGALWRLREGASAVATAALGAGLFVLANSRPFEGLLVAVLACAAVLLTAREGPAGSSPRAVLGRMWLPLLLSTIAICAWTLAYNHQLTGDAFRLPYENWSTQDALRADIRSYTGSPERSFLGKMQKLQRFFLGNALVAVVPFLFLRRRSTRVVCSIAVVAVTALVSVLTTRGWPHYLAPAAVLTVLLTVEALRALWRVRVGRLRVGAAGVLLVVGCHLLFSARAIAGCIRGGPPESWHRDRQAIVEELGRSEQRHLILVRYLPSHSVHEEWVYNAADIDGSKIVWALDLGPRRNEALLRHFPDRRPWLLEVSAEDSRREPYAPLDPSRG